MLESGTLTHKKFLYNYLRNLGKEKPEIHKLKIMPKTYILSQTSDCIKFLEEPQLTHQYILKKFENPKGSSIHLIQNLPAYRRSLSIALKKYSNLPDRPHERAEFRKIFGAVVQEYLQNPLLLEGYKCNLRVFLIIQSTDPFLCYLHRGYYTRASMLYEEGQKEQRMAYLSNLRAQKLHKDFNKIENELVWSQSRFEEYITEKYADGKDGRSPGELLDGLWDRVRTCLRALVENWQKGVSMRRGTFEVLNCDFVISDDFQEVYLVDINSRASIRQTTPVGRRVAREVILQSIDNSLTLLKELKGIEEVVRHSELQSDERYEKVLGKMKTEGFELLWKNF